LTFWYHPWLDNYRIYAVPEEERKQGVTDGCGKQKSIQKREGERESVSANVSLNFTFFLEMEKRPWGGYRLLSSGAGFAVKTLHVSPGARLSLQSHVGRAEQWLVLQGTATVRIGEEYRTLEKGESCTVPLGALHRLGNEEEATELVVLETQYGELIDEDDIRRYEDDYGRT
jgi:mannose-6-phosphate isomerase-like protein (cupin superfamily)